MQKKTYNIIGLVIMLMVFACIYIYYIPNIFLNPNGFLFEHEGDGIKNYYASLYQLKYGKGFYFTGMAYPWGDSFLFTDGQPLLTGILYVLKAFLPVSQNYTVGIINTLVLAGPVITVLVLKKLFNYYKVNTIYGWLFAIGISLLSPQIERINAHQSLSYSFFIPALWLLILRLRNKPGIVSAIVYILFVLAFTFMHPYYLAIALVFYFMYLFVLIIFKKISVKNEWLKIMFFIFTGIIPLLGFQLFVFLTVSANNRVDIPWGFTFNRSAFKSIFFNHQSPLYFLQLNFLDVGKGEWEGKAYLGFWAFYIFLAYIIYSVIKKFNNLKNLPKSPLHLFLYAGILAYVFSTAFPFYITPFDEILYLFPPLTQFRASGRFAWILFFTFQVFLAVWVTTNSYFKYTLKHTLIIIVLITLYIEGLAHINNRLAYIKTSYGNNFFLYAEPNLAYINIDEFEAILPIKLFATGSEQMGLTHTNTSIKNALWLSYKTGLPIIGYSMARSKVNIAMQTVQLAGMPIVPKLITADLPPNKDILLLVSDTVNLSSGEIDLINQSALLVKDKQYMLYRLKIDNINKTANYFANNLPVNTNKTLFAPLRFMQNKGNSLNGFYTIIDKKAKHICNNDSVTFSVLTTKSSKYFGIPEIFYQERDTLNNIVASYSSLNKENYTICGNQIRLQYTFKPLHSEHNITIKLYGKDFNFYSVLLQQPNSCFTYYNPVDGNIYFNNYLLAAKKH